MPKDSHCGDCGTPYGPAVDRPRTCRACGAVAHRNPLPVAVALQPVRDADGIGLVVITRSIAPQLGGVALPGGFIDADEEWQHAVVRELREETGIDVPARDVRLADALSAPSGHLLLFGLLPELPADAVPSFAPTDETSDRGLLRTPAELAFPLHTTAVRRWFLHRYDRGVRPA